MKNICGILVLLIIFFSPQIAVGLDDSQQEFIESWITAINTDDSNLLKQIIHPTTLGSIKAQNSDYYHMQFTLDLKKSIPEKYDASLKVMESDEREALEEDQRYVYPIEPSHVLMLDFKTNKYSGERITRYCVQENGRWYLVFPNPSEETLALFHQSRTLEIKNKRKAREIAKDLEPEFIEQLRGLVNDGRQLKAYELLKEAKDISIGVSKSLLQELKIVQ